MARIREFVSSIRRSPVSDFVYSTFGWYAPQRGGAIPGTWFVRALGSLGVEEAAVRMALYRMEHSGVLTAQRRGRSKLYAATPTTLAVVNAGRARVFDEADKWDGRWSIVIVRGKDHSRLRDVLMVEGFSALGDAFVHPQNRVQRVVTAAEAIGLARELIVFRGAPTGGRSDAELAALLWPVGAVATRYRMFIERFSSVDPAALSPFEAFAARYAMMFEFFRTTWNDPSLPESILPPPWPGVEARTLARTLYEKLQRPAMRHADEIMASAGR